MHHFKLKTREVVEVYRFEGVEAVNSIQNVLMNFIMERACTSDTKKSQQGGQIQIIAPKLFMNSTYKQCNLTDKGTIQNRLTRQNSEVAKMDKFGVRFEGVIFPLAISMISDYIR